MDDVSFSCSGCQQTLEAPPEMAGQMCECPNCGQEIMIPQPEQEAVAESPQIPVSDAMADTMAAALQAVDGEAEGATGNTCSECGGEMEAEAVLCVQCGFHKGLGKKIDTDLS